MFKDNKKDSQKLKPRAKDQDYTAILTIDVDDNTDITHIPQKGYSRTIHLTGEQTHELGTKNGYIRLIETLVGRTNYSAYLTFFNKKEVTWIKRPKVELPIEDRKTIGLPPSSKNLSIDLSQEENQNLQIKFDEPLIESTNYQKHMLKRVRAKQTTDK